MSSLTMSFSKRPITYILAENSKLVAYENDVPIGTATYHSPKTVT